MAYHYAKGDNRIGQDTLLSRHLQTRTSLPLARAISMPVPFVTMEPLYAGWLWLLYLRGYMPVKTGSKHNCAIK